MLVFFLLPFTPASARFLNDREKTVAVLRVLKDGSAETDTKLTRKTFLAPLKDWKYYVFVTICAPFIIPCRLKLTNSPILRGRYRCRVQLPHPDYRSIWILGCQDQLVHRCTLYSRHGIPLRSILVIRSPSRARLPPSPLFHPGTHRMRHIGHHPGLESLSRLFRDISHHHGLALAILHLSPVVPE